MPQGMYLPVWKAFDEHKALPEQSRERTWDVIGRCRLTSGMAFTMLLAEGNDNMVAWTSTH